MERIINDGQLQELLEIIKQKGTTTERLNQLLKSGVLADVLDPAARLDRKAVRKALKLDVGATEIFTLTVDYDLGLWGMVEAGDYSSVALQIEWFKIKGQGIHHFEARLIHFNRAMFPKVILSEIASLDPANPWSPGKIEHLLALGDQYPEEQCKHYITALGSVANVRGAGDYRASLSATDENADGKTVSLSRLLSADVAISSALHHTYRFLVVRKTFA